MEFVLRGDEGVAGGGVGVAGVEFGFVGGVQALVGGADGGEAVVVLVRLVVGDAFEGAVGVFVGPEMLRRHADFGGVGHGVCAVGKRLETLSMPATLRWRMHFGL